ncbi:hypothetical protein K469DRAFT_772116 [Zopfia rhizophila CBS 207.26]|uniref:Amino acid permease/ SLC12A domain-containing protein n=1 Tax=Zopfia rhizophila CBS 207.26 TaxID=1314779 RepID=A0A6A6E6N8_9PEZI|nr:hypothetical protein K469DRAFT_772116 [Zopfia rhizophila CBS 207.26]
MADRRPLDRNPYYVEHFEHFHRVLRRPHLTGIGISGCVGAGVLVSSGALIAISGSIGAPLSYLISGFIVICVMYSMSEMVACRPLTGALVDFPHTFLDPACGFAVAASYGHGKLLCFPLQPPSGLIGQLTNAGKLTDGAEAGANVGFIVLTTLSHCFGIILYGRIERVVMWFKLSLLLLVCIFTIIINAGGGGPRNTSYNANYTTHAFAPGFRPLGFGNVTGHTTLTTRSTEDANFGLSGPGGRLFAFLTSVTLAMFAYTRREIVIMTAGEAQEPFKDVPTVTSFVYLVPLILYPFVVFSAGANVNYMDPNLPLIWARNSGSKSPFVIAVESSSLHGLHAALTLFFIISAYTAANTALYTSSRSGFILAQTYMHDSVARTFGRTNNGNTPLAAILLCSALGFLTLIGLANDTYSQPRLTLGKFYTGSITCVYVCECVTFLRFKAGLDRLKALRIFSRDDPLYISRLFKSRWQPVPAIIGIIGCSFILLWSGIPPLYILAARRSSASADELKGPVGLAFDVIGAYLGPVIFAIFYLTYKYGYPRSYRVDLRDLTPDMYILEDVGSFEREKGEDAEELANQPPRVEVRPGVMELEAQRGGADANAAEDIAAELDPEEEAERARERQRQYVLDTLEMRQERTSRGIWREFWSYIISD